MTQLKNALDIPMIVVIEDEHLVLSSYQMLLESWGYQVIAATDCANALDELKTSSMKPSFILADFRLRENLTGTDAIQTIRKHYGTDIPAVLITGDTAVDRLREAAASGLPIVHKPINGRQLRDILRHSLGCPTEGLGAQQMHSV